MMRIITGTAKGRRLETLEGDATRPTSERIKGAIFSSIQFECEGRVVLDLFAGSGQMGLEAISRGAAHAVLCDRAREAVDVIRKNAEKTRLLPSCEILCMDYEVALRSFRRKRRFDLVFLDPPYALGVMPAVLSALTEEDLLTPNAIVVCETAGEDDVFGGNEKLRARFDLVRGVRYGAAYVTVLRLCKSEEAEI